MRLLIVEDDANKLAAASQFLGSALPGVRVDSKRSYRSGLAALVQGEGRPDVVILDMTLPTYDVTPSERGGRIRPFGGREILAELKRRGIPSRVIVLTQFESFGEGPDLMTLSELTAQLARDYRGLYVGAVFYNPAESVWKERVLALIREVEEGGRMA